MGTHVSGNIRHELRTPLNHIIGYSEMLLEEMDNSTPSLREDLAEINAFGKALLDYVNSFSAAEVASATAGTLAETEWRTATDAIEARCARLGELFDGDADAAEWLSDIGKIMAANHALARLFRRGLETNDEPSTTAVAATPTAANSAVVEERMPHGEELLVVDDNPANRDLLERRLTRDGYTVVTAEGGRQALELIGIRRFDLVLLDLMMPEMNGIEVLKAIRQRYSHTDLPVIMVTAKSASEDVVRALECGANDYVTKPIDFPVARARISTQLSLRRLTQELEIANEKLRAFSYLDGLTGIPNRRHFDEYLAREWSRASRTRLPVSLILMDVDFFKPYNDNYGHEAGDQVLKQVAKALAGGLLRDGDLVARYGGEEFVAVLPQTPVKAALDLAELLRARVAGLKIPHGHSPSGSHVTASFGVCSMVPELGHGSEVLLQNADKALYHAKRRARNCVSCIGDTTVPTDCVEECAIQPKGCLAANG